MSEQHSDRQVRWRLGIIRHAEEQTGNVAMTCRYYGISRAVYYRWLRRYEEEGLEGLRDRSRRPKTCPHQTHVDVVGQILYLRQNYHLLTGANGSGHLLARMAAVPGFLPEGHACPWVGEASAVLGDGPGMTIACGPGSSVASDDPVRPTSRRLGRRQSAAPAVCGPGCRESAQLSQVVSAPRFHVVSAPRFHVVRPRASDAGHGGAAEAPTHLPSSGTAGVKAVVRRSAARPQGGRPSMRTRPPPSLRRPPRASQRSQLRMERRRWRRHR